MSVSGDADAMGSEPFTAPNASKVLGQVCRDVGLEDAGAVLLRLGSNAVYSLPSTRVLVRIGKSLADLPQVERMVRANRWLAEVGFPAARLVDGVVQPLVVSGRVVTFWELAQDRIDWATIPELADLLRALHWLEEPESLGLGQYKPLGDWGHRMAAMTGVSAEDREFLDERAELLGKLYDRLDFVLPYGMIHGDANVGNAIRNRDGRAILIDWDGVALGPREWDLVLTAMFYERYGWHTREEYEAFVFHYGFDIMNWPGYPVLADLRELMMVAWLAGKVDAEPRLRDEFDKRIAALRTGASRADWKPL